MTSKASGKSAANTAPVWSLEPATSPALFTVDRFLPSAACQQWISRADDKGWNKSSPSGGGHGRTGKEDPRTNKFCVLSDEKAADAMWELVRPKLQQDLAFLGDNVYFHSVTKGAEWKPVGVCERMRLYKYEPGDCFPEHIDYKMRRKVWRQHGAFIQQSFLSLLVYLNCDFQGGQTGYWPNHVGIHCRFLRDTEVKPHQVRIDPVVGKAVVQDQNILHEGLPPTKGVKYLLRTDIIHERPWVSAVDPPKKLGPEPWERLFETSCKNYAD